MLSKTELKGSTRIIWKLQKPLRKIPCPPRKWSNKRKKQNNSEKNYSKNFSKLSQIYRNQKKTKNICHLLITYHDYHILCVIFVAFLQLWFIHLIISCHQFCKFEALLTGSSDQTTNLESTNPEFISQYLLLWSRSHHFVVSFETRKGCRKLEVSFDPKIQFAAL